MVKSVYLSVEGFLSFPSSSPSIPVFMGYDIAAHESGFFNRLLPGKVLLVCDSNTFEAAGKRLHKHLHGRAEILQLPSHQPPADEAGVENIRGALAQFDSLLAVGSGVISDLCKYASYLEHKPYLMYATALSMNGYASQNASIAVRGHKKTLKAHLPSAIFIDLPVIAQAPAYMNLSGLGDSICRSTAQADWLMSHLLLGTAYTALPFKLLEPFESALFENGHKITSGDAATLELLAHTLLASGMGMVVASGSYPASEGEHLIAHTMEMKHGEQNSSHGEQIAVTTLTMAELQRQLLLDTSPVLEIPTNYQQEIERYYGYIATEVLKEYETKLRIFKPHKRWDEIREAIAAVTQPAQKLKNILLDAGCPTTPQDINWSSEDYAQAVSHACYARNRFTFLDIAKANGYI